jgi:two-component system chemotaxis sensor kinase CheA
MTDPYRYFRIEARELVDQLSKGVLDLERGPADGLVARLLRIAHTLKGAARVVKQTEIADRTHAIEDALVPFRDGSPVPRDRIEVALHLLDEIEARMRALSQPVGAGTAAPEQPLPAIAVDTAAVDEVIDGLAEAHAQVRSARQALAGIATARHLAELIAGGSAGAGQPIGDELRSALDGIARGLGPAIERLDRELRQAVEAAERLRLAPARGIFLALERTARDSARAVGKEIEFSGRDGEVRLDPQVLGTIAAALVEAVRNAVAHGIESPEARLAAGKPRSGRIEIAVERRGRQVAFIASDDGQGVDLDAVRRAALGRGHPGAEIQRLGSAELLQLLLRGGISTSGTVTEVAGRGVGLDVVRAAVDRLGGTVEVDSEPGRGTRIRLLVPISLSTVPVLMVESAGAAAVIPRDAVRRAERIPAGAISCSAEGESIVHEAQAIRFSSLSRVLGVADPGAPGRSAGAATVVVVAGAGSAAAIAVDRLIGISEVVVRRLPALAPASPVVAGATLDIDGRPRLVLDPDALVAAVLGMPAPTVPASAAKPVILVVDDSLTTRMLEQSILAAAGYTVDLATSGEEALEMVCNRSYALVLLDVEMPGIDGFTCIERLRADPSTRAIPVLLVTSRDSPDDRRRSNQAGANGHIVKSEFDQNDLLARIRALAG